MKNLLWSLILTLPLLTAGIAQADTCEDPCPDGQVRVSFADGNNVNCICTEPGAAMVDNTTDNPEGDGTGAPPGEDL